MANQDRDLERVNRIETSTQSAAKSGMTARRKPGPAVSRKGNALHGGGITQPARGFRNT